MKRVFLMITFLIVIAASFAAVNVLSADDVQTETSKIENTGSLAVEESSVKEIDAAFVTMKNCIKCGLCAAVCPSDAIEMIDHKPVIDPEKCTKCGLCLKRCPTKAITYETYEIEEKSESKDSDKPETDKENKSKK